MFFNFSEKRNNASLLESVRNSLMPRRSKLASQVEWENGNWKLKPLLCLTLSLVRKPCDTHSSISKLWYHWVRYSNCDIQMAQTVWRLQAHVDVCVSGASFCVGLEIKQFSKSHEKPWCVWTYLWYTCDILCSGGVVLFELCTFTHSLLTYLHWPFCIIWHNFIYETNMPCLTNQFLAISLRSNIWEYIEPVYNPNICNIISDLWS